MFVKPAPHPDHPDDPTKLRVVRVPHTFEQFPAEGREVPDIRFWRKRVLQGCVIVTEAPSPAPAPQPEPKPETAEVPAAEAVHA